FIEIDKNIPIEDLVNNQEIINLVLQENSESSDSPNTNEEVEILKSISYSEAHSAIQTTLMFLEQNRNDNIKVLHNFLPV
ncbi:9576_t:CDS:2, partial [Paraglomus brasilianum]